MLNSSLSVSLCVIFFFASQVQGNIRDGPTHPGKTCDIEFYDKFVRPSSEAIDKLLQTDLGPNFNDAAELRMIVKTFEETIDATIDVPSDIRPDYAQEYKSRQRHSLLATKACTGLAAPYLTCEPRDDVYGPKCACKSWFPFNNTLDRQRCFPNPGSICRVGNSFELPCLGQQEEFCRRETGGDFHYCGGLAQFNKTRAEYFIETNSGVANVISSSFVAVTLFALCQF